MRVGLTESRSLGQAFSLWLLVLAIHNFVVGEARESLRSLVWNSRRGIRIRDLAIASCAFILAELVRERNALGIVMAVETGV
jgi:hypothetical protein